jgi:hypothetical protein
MSSFYYGRCRSGRRWFWAVSSHGLHEVDAYGWEDTEAAALDAAHAAIELAADGRKASTSFFNAVASLKLKAINAAKRTARPASANKDSKLTEYLFASYYYDSEMTDGYRVFMRFPIVKKTAKRVYYSNAKERVDELSGEPEPQYFGVHRLDETKVGFVDRHKLEADGEVRNRGRHWSDYDYHLYASLEALRNSRRRSDDEEPDLPALKAAMVAAHPDHGGNSEAFIAARAAYVRARRSMRPEPPTSGERP